MTDTDTPKTEPARARALLSTADMNKPGTTVLLGRRNGRRSALSGCRSGGRICFALARVRSHVGGKAAARPNGCPQRCDLQVAWARKSHRGGDAQIKEP